MSFFAVANAGLSADEDAVAPPLPEQGCATGRIRLRAYCAQRAFDRRHWPADFLGSSPANAGLCCLWIDSSNAGGLHLFVCFPRPPPHCDFLVEKSVFSALPRIYAECAR